MATKSSKSTKTTTKRDIPPELQALFDGLGRPKGTKSEDQASPRTPGGNLTGGELEPDAKAVPMLGTSRSAKASKPAKAPKAPKTQAPVVRGREVPPEYKGTKVPDLHSDNAPELQAFLEKVTGYKSGKTSLVDIRWDVREAVLHGRMPRGSEGAALANAARKAARLQLTQEHQDAINAFASAASLTPAEVLDAIVKEWIKRTKRTAK